MTQDTRKDRRVKIVSLNVRYKSATVDEFIENHAHDVSRGGIYIKTGSPFPPGTLLKFEIRLASDQAVIMGVGRVVWKRDTVQGTGERPSGMGVKFIKIDDPSKGVIDKLVNSRADAGQAYESESESPLAEPPPAAAAAGKPAPSPNRNVGKSTMLGMGALPGGTRPASNRPSAGTSSTAARPGAGGSSSSGGGMFPKTNSEADMPPKQEQTVMKQAAELLEEALREAGGSMEDVGTNPLFAGSPGESKAESASPLPPAEPAQLAEPAQPAEPVQPPAVAAEPPSATEVEAARARAIIAGMSPASVAPKKGAGPSDPPRTRRESPSAKAPERVSVRPDPSRPSGRVSIASAPPKPPKKGGSGMLVLLGVVAIAAFVGVTYRDAIFGAPPAPVPPPTVAAVPPAPTPTVSAAAEAPSATPSSSDAASADASAPIGDAAIRSDAASGDAASAAVASASTHPVVVARPIAPRPVAPAPVPTTPPTSGSDTPATATATAASTATTAPTTTTPPAPKPKPTAKPADDNPY